MNEEKVRQLAKNILSEQMSEEIKKHLDGAIIFKYINDMENQLQAYKDKEYKLREYCKETPIPFKDEVNKWAEDGRTWAKDAILQILNEGDK